MKTIFITITYLILISFQIRANDTKIDNTIREPADNCRLIEFDNIFKICKKSIPIDNFDCSSDYLLEVYLKWGNGLKYLALLAHPTNKFKSGHVMIIKPTFVGVILKYEGGYETVITLKRNGNFFTSIKINKDKDYVPAFKAIKFIKNVAYSKIEKDRKKQSQFEKLIGKAVTEMSGEQLACLILSLHFQKFIIEYGG